jgi:hypothetical protein
MDLPDWKEIGNASAQAILALGYVPAGIIIRALWKRVLAGQKDVIEFYQKNNADNDARREIANGQVRAIDKLADNVRDLERRLDRALSENRGSHVAR